MAQLISYADVYIWFYEKSTKIQFHCTVPNEIRLIRWLYYQSVLLSCLTLSLKENLSAFFKTELSSLLNWPRKWTKVGM